MDTTHLPPHLPPQTAPPIYEHDPAEEVDVDLEDVDEVEAQADGADGADEAELEAAALARATVPEGYEYLGEFESVEAYLRSMFEPEISRGCAWLLDCLDWPAVIARFEADGCRYFCGHGHVYRVALEGT